MRSRSKEPVLGTFGKFFGKFFFSPENFRVGRQKMDFLRSTKWGTGRFAFGSAGSQILEGGLDPPLPKVTWTHKQRL